YSISARGSPPAASADPYRLLQAQPPAHPLPVAVRQEVDQRPHLVTVQVVDGVVQPLLRVLLKLRRQGIVDAVRPALLFKGGQDRPLGGSGLSKLFDHVLSQTKPPLHAVPAGDLRPIGRVKAVPELALPARLHRSRRDAEQGYPRLRQHHTSLVRKD